MTEKTYSLKLNEKVIEYSVRRSRRRRKTMAILLHSERGVVVMVPHRTTESQLNTFIENRRQWIAKKLPAVEAAKLPPRQFAAGTPMRYLGVDYPLNIQPTPTAGTVILQSERLTVWVPRAHFSADKQPLWIGKALERWYASVAEKELNRIAARMIKETGLTPSKVSIKKLKASWGLCRGTTITLSRRLVMAPIPLIEYVVAHELCHLEHKNHSKTFWAAVDAIMPDHGSRRERLKQLGL